MNKIIINYKKNVILNQVYFKQDIVFEKKGMPNIRGEQSIYRLFLL